MGLTQPVRAARFAEEGCLALVRLDKVNLAGAEDREDQAGQAGAAAQVDHHPGAARRGRGQMGHELGRVEESGDARGPPGWPG